MTDRDSESSVTRARQRIRRARHKLVFKITTRSPTRHRRVGPSFLWAMKRRFQFEFLTSHGLRSDHTLLDIGCGSLRGGIPLIEYLDTGRYTGIEPRPKVLDEGRRELAQSGLEHKRPRLIQAEHPRQIEIEAPFDFAWAFMVLIHMPDDVVREYFDFVSRGLAQDGVFYANALLGDAPEKKWESFPVVSRPRDRYEQWASSSGLIVEDVGTLESLGHRAGEEGDGMMMLRFTRASA